MGAVQGPLGLGSLGWDPLEEGLSLTHQADYIQMQELSLVVSQVVGMKDPDMKGPPAAV